MPIRKELFRRCEHTRGHNASDTVGSSRGKRPCVVSGEFRHPGIQTPINSPVGAIGNSDTHKLAGRRNRARTAVLEPRGA
jgi:hypothetical protein